MTLVLGFEEKCDLLTLMVANRAVSFTSRNGNTIIECGYDYQGRRYMKKVTQNGTVASHERYLYRGYLQIAALDMLDNRDVLRTLLWDPLEPVATRPLALVQDASLYCYGVDFNKNVSEVFDAQGTIAAAYDYSPYGTATRTGRLVQPVQWSGEMHDEEPALAYYNYRFYNPKDGRWINRDPIAEQGGWNLYAFLGNSPQDKFDALGLEDKKKDKEFLGYVYDQTLEGTDIYICETTGLKINDKILNNTVSESMNTFKEANSANQAASNIRYAKDFSKKVSKLYKVTPGTKIPGVKISAISDIINFVYIKTAEKVAYQQFYEAATRYQTIKKKTFADCFELCVAMGEYAKVFLKNDLGRGMIKFNTDYCISKCGEIHKH
ncbi:RHS repeat domain-containing protein [Akkermansia muciniphila]|uniref:RHS repeat domain-containing protein n=1 Tax=Akkermansia muciniphila TaxID=239935 RepID=UPI0029E821C7|nr:RHS repeat-associated core domain-containing protein [Akkermansia muciniphila]WPK65573.1 RHS repeat-associated core domain-containing protein [Akkermansia muciniphila]